MISKFLRCALIGSGLVALLPTAGIAADFGGPTGWTKVDVPSSTPTRTIAQWHISGDRSASVTYISDASVGYADSLAMITKNFSDNGIKASNKDVACRGASAHVVEFTAGPDGSGTIINRMIVPQGAGSVAITYTRAAGNAFDDEVKKAETDYCTSP